MGKIDIDYQKLHDAFFKYQTKPKMTIHGDLYYEVRYSNTSICLWHVLKHNKFVGIPSDYLLGIQLKQNDYIGQRI